VPTLVYQTIHSSSGIGTPIDDETHLFWVSTSDCHFDIAIRQRVRRRDDTWASLLVQKRRRPNLSPEARKELDHQLMENMKSRIVSPDVSVRNRRAQKAHRSIGNLSQHAGVTLSTSAPFNDAPSVCFAALSDDVIDQNSITFPFATDLPGDRNRFTIDRRLEFNFGRACLTASVANSPW
jgi:hypothetical protein